MLERDLALTSIDLAIGLLTIFLGTFVYLRNPYLGLSKLFLALTGFFSVASFTSVLVLNASDSGTALLWARVEMFVVIASMAAQFYMITVLPIEKNPRALANHKGSYILISLASALAPAIMIDGVDETTFGHMVRLGPGLVIFIGVIIWYLAASVSALISVYERSKEELRNLTLLLTVGISFPVAFIIVKMLLMLAGFDLPPVFPFGFLLSTTVFLYAVVGHDLFQLKLAMPDKMTATAPLPVEVEGRGHCVLVEGKRRTQPTRCSSRR